MKTSTKRKIRENRQSSWRYIEIGFHKHAILYAMQEETDKAKANDLLHQAYRRRLPNYSVIESVYHEKFPLNIKI